MLIVFVDAIPEVFGICLLSADYPAGVALVSAVIVYSWWCRPPVPDSFTVNRMIFSFSITR
jgi:hypothetical protein